MMCGTKDSGIGAIRNVSRLGIALLPWLCIVLGLVLGIKVLKVPIDQFDFSAFLATLVSIAAVALSVWLNLVTVREIGEFRERAITHLEKSEIWAQSRHDQVVRKIEELYHDVNDAVDTLNQKETPEQKRDPEYKKAKESLQNLQKSLKTIVITGVGNPEFPSLKVNASVTTSPNKRSDQSETNNQR